MQPYKITFACRHFIRDKKYVGKNEKNMDAGVDKKSLNCIKRLTLFPSKVIFYI